MKPHFFVMLGVVVGLAGCPPPAHSRQSIQALQSRAVLDDYEANVVFGYNIVMQTGRYAGRYAGNLLSCTNCHLQGGTKPDAFPLKVAGMYPKWRAKNGVRNGIGLRIRECFLYSLNGIMPPEESPEVQAVAAYISYLSEGEVIGRPPKGWGVPTLPATGTDPNPPRGQIVYERECALCHGKNGEGGGPGPALWGPNSYNAGAGLNNVRRLGGFIWANMPMGKERTLTHQEALDVAAFLGLQHRPFDPRHGLLKKLMERFYQRFFGASGKATP